MTNIKKPKITVPEVPPLNGGGGWDLNIDEVEPFAWADNLFSENEMDAIIELGNSIGLSEARTMAQKSADIRKSSVSFIFPNESTAWIFRALTDAVKTLNDNFFGFALTGMMQGLQFTKYEAPGEHYVWHTDRTPQGASRKLSLVLQLSNPDDYEGGDLELWSGGEPIQVKKERGFIAMFPSWTMHRVTPVTKGIRHSLVCWVSGPSFK